MPGSAHSARSAHQPQLALRWWLSSAMTVRYCPTRSPSFLTTSKETMHTLRGTQKARRETRCEWGLRGWEGTAGGGGGGGASGRAANCWGSGASHLYRCPPPVLASQASPGPCAPKAGRCPVVRGRQAGRQAQRSDWPRGAGAAPGARLPVPAAAEGRESRRRRPTCPSLMTARLWGRGVRSGGSQWRTAGANRGRRRGARLLEAGEAWRPLWAWARGERARLEPGSGQGVPFPGPPPARVRRRPPTRILPHQLHGGGADDEQGPVLGAKAGRDAERLRPAGRGRGRGQGWGRGSRRASTAAGRDGAGGVGPCPDSGDGRVDPRVCSSAACGWEAGTCMA